MFVAFACRAQPQGIANDRSRTQAHRERSDHGAEQKVQDRVQHAGRDRDAERVVGERESQVLLRVAHRGVRQLTRAQEPRKSPLTSVTCALDIATSVPVPIATPTSAGRGNRGPRGGALFNLESLKDSQRGSSLRSGFVVSEHFQENTKVDQLGFSDPACR
jgi:hypothetical protein